MLGWPRIPRGAKKGAMESYPFHHHNLFFNIVTDYDLTFEEIRGILDYLVRAEAFKEEGENWGEGKFYDIQLFQFALQFFYSLLNSAPQFLIMSHLCVQCS